MTPEMERRLRSEVAKFGKNQAIKPVDMVPMKGLAALGRQAIMSGIRGQVRPVNSKEIAEMARRYAEKDKRVLQDIGKLTKRQQQMVRDEIAQQYKQIKLTPMDKAKSLARKIDKKLDPANTGRTGAIGIGIEEQTPTTQLDEVTIMKSKKYSKGGSLKPVPAGKPGLSKLPTEVRNKMGYMMGGGKLDMMYQNGGMMGGKKKQDPPRKITDVLDRNGRVISPERRKLEAAAAPMMEKYANRAFNANAKAREMENLTEMRNQLKKSDPDAVAAFDRSLKAKGMMVAKRPVKKMAQGGVIKKAGAPNPLNPTKDKDSFISNAVDMSPATKKQMMALRQAMMYFTGVSPKNK